MVSSRAMKNRMRGCARHCICLLAFLTWLFGTGLVGFVLWIVVTSSAFKQFIQGTQLFTYVVVIIGFLLLLYGAIGCLGTFRKGNCCIKFFLLLSVLTLALEIGGIITLNFLNIKMDDIFEAAWKEVNQNSRNVIQEQLGCCGFLGPEEFSSNTDPIDDSCFYSFSGQSDANSSLVVEERRMHRIGCKKKLEEWFEGNQLIWIAALVFFILYQISGVLLAVYVISQGKSSRRSSLTSLDNERSHTYL